GCTPAARRTTRRSSDRLTLSFGRTATMEVFAQFSAPAPSAVAGPALKGGAARMRDRSYEPGAVDSRWLGAVMHAAFFLLLGGALARFLLRHPGEPRTPWIIALCVVLAALHLLGPGTAGA